MEANYLQSISLINKADNQFIRDLIWLIYSEPIVDLENFSFHFAHEGMLYELYTWLNKNKIEIKESETINLPLGKYAEVLTKYYLENSPKYKLLAANIQLIENKITVGELDYLFKDLETNKFVHLEFSIKYYLKTKIKNRTFFLGPSTKDWMARKVLKLKNHQTQLSKTHNQLLPKDLAGLSFEQKAIIKGCIFYPWDEWSMKKEKNETAEGWWINLGKASELNEQQNRFQIIKEKKSWIFPYSSDLNLLDYEKLESCLKLLFKDFNELMVVRYDKDENPTDRGFIVNDHWPSSHPNWDEEVFRML